MSNGLLADGPKEYAETFGKRWLVTDYEAGDVVLHTPYTVSPLTSLHARKIGKMGKGGYTDGKQIHASTLNYDPNDVIRVGTDLRFVNGSKPWDKASAITRLQCAC